MGEEGVEVRLGAKVEDLRVMRVVDVGEHAEKLAVDVLHGRGEGVVKFLICGYRVSSREREDQKKGLG